MGGSAQVKDKKAAFDINFIYLKQFMICSNFMAQSSILLVKYHLSCSKRKQTNPEIYCEET